MVTIRITSPVKELREDREFAYSHTAKSWLLLAGFLPTEDDNLFCNVYTGAVAELLHRR